MRRRVRIIFMNGVGCSEKDYGERMFWPKVVKHEFLTLFVANKMLGQSSSGKCFG